MKSGLRVKWTETWDTPLRRFELSGLYDEDSAIPVRPVPKEITHTISRAIQLLAMEPMGHA